MYKGKIILVTGASRGIGKDIAKHFLKNEAIVLGLSKGKQTENHENYFHFSVDLSDARRIADCFREISKSYKHIDVVINNAAVLTSQYAMIIPLEKVIEMVNVNLLSVFIVSREAAKLMRKRGYGRIINIGSMAASLEPIGDSIYAACKAGINTLANVMAKEFSSFGITCNTLAISAFETDMLRQLPKEKIDQIIDKLPIPRYATSDDILNVIDFYTSERSSYITAQIIYLGGVN